MPNFMMLQQLQVLQQPSKHRPIFEKIRKIAANFIKIWKYSINRIKSLECITSMKFAMEGYFDLLYQYRLSSPCSE